MMEYSNRVSRLYFAGKAGNWDMAKYQIGEMLEIQEVGETTRPNRAPLLKAFEDGFLNNLGKAIDAKDPKAFDAVYTAAIGGCNACHAASKSADWNSFKFIKVQVPTVDDNDFIHWAAKKSTGNSIANPPAAATAVPIPPPTGTLDMAGVEKLVNAKFNTVDTSLALWNIQPGLGTVMMEYSNRLTRVWFAANADNWDMAKYQVAEMLEIQEVGETTRPNRAPLLKAFEDGFLNALDKAIDTKDKTVFKAAFDKTITGCNACHSASKATDWSSFGFVEVQQPQTDPASFVQWKTPGGTGNYKP
jgi:cytochrome c553